VKVVIAGGTGFLGRHITRALLEADHEVTVLGRSPEKVARIPDLHGANATKGDVTESTSLIDKLKGTDAVLMVAQFPNHPIEVPRKGLTYDRYDRQGTENLLAEAKRSNVGRFFYISGAGADPNSDKTWYRAKGRAEAAIKASGLSYAILRPSWAYGPEDKALNKFALMARISPAVFVPGTKPQRVQPVHVDDIAAAVAAWFGPDGAKQWSQTLEIGSRELMTMHEIVETMLDVMGKKRLIVHIPLALLKAATAPLIVLPKPPMTPQGLEFATQDGPVDVGPLIEKLGVVPVDLHQGLSRYL
jgi:NADH dehydrogenase